MWTHTSFSVSLTRRLVKNQIHAWRLNNRNMPYWGTYKVMDLQSHFTQDLIWSCWQQYRPIPSEPPKISNPKSTPYNENGHCRCDLWRQWLHMCTAGVRQCTPFLHGRRLCWSFPDTTRCPAQLLPDSLPGHSHQELQFWGKSPIWCDVACQQ